MSNASVVDSFLDTIFGSLPVSPPALVARAEMRAILEDKERVLLDLGLSESEAAGRAIAEVVRDELLQLDVFEETTPDLPTNPTSAHLDARSSARTVAPVLARMIDAIYWPIVALIFFLWSVSSGDWHITWTILPVAAVLYWVFRRAINGVSEQRDRTADS